MSNRKTDNTLNFNKNCFTCLSISGIKPLFPESLMYEGKFWIVEHAYPVKIKGWIVIILKRHVESLHELSQEEFLELSKLQRKICQALHQELNSKKEYSICFAEGKHFNHIHFHLIARSNDLADEFKGPAIYSMLKIDLKDSLSKKEIILFCNRIKKYLS
jgi:diadenosine tetraphosphate (Ap4A) HIT family hydrolase